MIELKCKNCGGILDVDNTVVVSANGETRIRDGMTASCPHCGAEYSAGDVLGVPTVVNVNITNVAQVPPEVSAPLVNKKSSSISRYLILLVALGFVALLVYGLATTGDKRVEAGMAPDFALTTFDGQALTLADLKGKVVVVNFWATWCLECEKEASDLEQAWRDYQDKGVQFVGIDYLDQAPLNQQYLDRYDITYPNGPDIQGRVYQAYGVQGLPETFVIDQNGAVRKVFIGAATRDDLAFEIDKLLAEKS